MLEPMMYEGGVYKHNLLVELVEDLGGYILQKNIMQTEVIMIMLVPMKDTDLVEDMTRKIMQFKIREAKEYGKNKLL